MGRYPDLSIIQKRLTGGGRWVGLLCSHGLDRTPRGAQSHHQTVTKTKRSVTEDGGFVAREDSTLSNKKKRQQTLVGLWRLGAAQVGNSHQINIPPHK